MTHQTVDVVIIGGGIMGSSTAYFLLKADPKIKVAVVEMDPAFTRASTTLSMANARIQFSLKQNIQISQFAFEVLEGFGEEMAVDGEKPNIGFCRDGNLFLYDPAQHSDAQQSMALQKSLGCRVQWMDPQQITEKYPLYSPGGMVGGTFGPDDGYFDAHAVLMGFRAKARSMGAILVTGKVDRILKENSRAAGVALESGEKISAGVTVNCAGAWAARVAKTAGVDIPVLPVKRQIFALDTKVKPQGPLPLTILPSGMYFRTETGGLILLGKSMEEDPVGFDFTWDRNRFMDRLWLELATFVPAFEHLKLVRGWAGLYAVNTLDENAILGPWPDLEGLYLANGFSGHGLQQAPAVGRYLAEQITGAPVTLDLSLFSPERILENRPLSEGGIV